MAMLRTTSRLLLLALAAGFAAACFNPPSGDVLFSCDPMGDDSCPSGYTCEADGCCHKDGSDVQASWGACGLSGNETGTATETATETATDTGSETSTDTTGSETGTETATDTTGETDTDTTGSETDTDTTGTDTDTTSG
jgi:hypothetical protein